jgi:hypothetical protein
VYAEISEEGLGKDLDGDEKLESVVERYCLLIRENRIETREVQAIIYDYPDW